MRFATLFLAVASAKAISGHTLFSTLFINDESQGDATCIRMPMDGATSTSPLIDLSSNDMACSKFFSPTIKSIHSHNTQMSMAAPVSRVSVQPPRAPG